MPTCFFGGNVFRIKEKCFGWKIIVHKRYKQVACLFVCFLLFFFYGCDHKKTGAVIERRRDKGRGRGRERGDGGKREARESESERL